MPGTPKTTDLPAGFAAAAVLLAGVFLLHLPFLLGLLVAALVYGGLALMLRRPDAPLPARPSLESQIAALDAAGQQIPAPAVRRQVADIAGQARAIAAYFGQHPDSAAQWEDYLRECLDTAQTGARQFAELAPHLSGPSDPAAVKFTDFLNTLAETLKGVYTQLVAADTADFSSSIDTYKNTLSEINQIYLGGGKS